MIIVINDEELANGREAKGCVVVAAKVLNGKTNK